MRKLKTAVKYFVFPAACLACVVWVAGFVLIGFRMQPHNAGVAMLLVLACLAFLIPWLAMVVAMGRRIEWNAETTPPK